jgi:hypothetical protein
MSRKDYEKFAQMMRQTHDLNKGQRETMANRIATILALDNPNFDRVRFIKACGV